MKNVVILDDIRESDIRPRKMMTELINLLKSDIRHLLSRRVRLLPVPCPGCRSVARVGAFEKFGLTYAECRNCQSLYLSPRPSLAELKLFYERSTAMKYWNSQISRQTQSKRDAHIYLPRLDWLSAVVRKNFTGKVSYADVQSKYDVLLKRISKTNLFDRRFAFDCPSSLKPRLEECGYEVFSDDIQATNGHTPHVSVLTAFEVLERVFSTKILMATVHRLLHGSGLLLLTTRAGSGFDVQVLRDRTENLLPLIHMNLLSVEGITHLMTASGFEILEMSTPGQLDMEIVRESLRERRLPPGFPRFLSYLLQSRDVDAHRAFQKFLQEYRLSSHLRLVARKKS